MSSVPSGRDPISIMPRPHIRTFECRRGLAAVGVEDEGPSPEEWCGRPMAQPPDGCHPGGSKQRSTNKGARGERTRRTGCRRPQAAGGRRVTGRLAPQAAGRQPSHGDPLRGLRLRGGGEPSSSALPHVRPCDVGRGADPRAEKLAVTHVTSFDRTFQENDAHTVVLVREETS